MGEQPEMPIASAGRMAPSLGPLSADRQPATKADLYAAVDALRADMRELLDQVRTLIEDADRRVADRDTGPAPHIGDDAW